MTDGDVLEVDVRCSALREVLTIAHIYKHVLSAVSKTDEVLGRGMCLNVTEQTHTHTQSVEVMAG